MVSKCYIARYPLNAAGNDLAEEILCVDTHWSETISQLWDKLVKLRKPAEPMLQAWYSSPVQVVCMARSIQPFALDLDGMKTALETIRENIARIERRMKRTKNQSQRDKLARLKGQWVFMLQAHNGLYPNNP